MRCIHIELVKVKEKWKCTKCGQFLTVSENLENTRLVSEAITIASATGRPLDEAYDDVIGRREWEEMLAGIPYKRRGPRPWVKLTSKRRRARAKSSKRRS